MLTTKVQLKYNIKTQDYVDDEPYDEPYRNTINDQMQRDSAPGVITEQKYSEVGNEKAVQQARDRYIQENNKRPIASKIIYVV
uniref:Uncharacterized protein n=2 Tax=Glossina TaxID=7393 RepID=A0A1B0BE11_9MUSC